VLRLQADAREGTEQAERADRGVEELALALARARVHVPLRVEQVELEDRVPHRADGEVVLAVDVRGGDAADRREARARDDAWPPAVRQRVAPEVAHADAGLDFGHAGRGIEGEDAIETRAIDDDAARARARVAVAVAR